MFNNFGNSPAVQQAGFLPAVDMQPLMRSVYAWMTAGLTISGVIAVVLANAFQSDINLFYQFSQYWFILFFIQLGLVLAMTFGLQRFSPTVLYGLFIVYAITMGVTLSGIIFGTIATPTLNPRTEEITMTANWGIVGLAFFTTAGVFGAMTFLGYTTKIDLTKFGSFLLMALIGLVIASVVNIFARSDALSFIISVAGVLIFTALTAYDTQKIKNMAQSGMVKEGTPDYARVAIMGAFTLYLDAINLFIYILRLFSRSSRS